MRSLSAERRDKTLSLLISSPVSMAEIVLGKYLGVILFLLIMVGMVCIMPLSLSLGTSLDMGKLFAGALGLLLMLSAFAAAGLYFSSLTVSPAVAAVASFFLLFGLWLMFWISSGGDQIKIIVEYISLLHHFVPMLKGTISSSDIAYFVLFAATFLVFTIRHMNSERVMS